MDRIINVKVNGSHLTKDSRKAGVQHESNAKKLRIEFDEGWDGYAKKVTFWDAKGLNPVERTLTADLLENMTASTRIYLCAIPGEAMTECGMMFFVIDGWANGVRQRSLSAELEVEEAPFIEQAGQPADPTPTQAEQLQGQIDTILEDMRAEAVLAENAKAGAEAAKERAEAAEKSAAVSANNAAASEKSAKQSEESAAVSAGNAEAIRNMTVTGTNVPPDSETPVVEKRVDKDGSIELHFNTRQGVSGVYVGGGEMPDGFNVQVSPESEDGAVDIYAIVEEAESWANAAQSYAEQATVPVVAGVYNVVLTDRVTADRYALIVENGCLKLLGVSESATSTELTLIDSGTGASYAVVIDSGKLILKEV